MNVGTWFNFFLCQFCFSHFSLMILFPEQLYWDEFQPLQIPEGTLYPSILSRLRVTAINLIYFNCFIYFISFYKMRKLLSLHLKHAFPFSSFLFFFGFLIFLLIYFFLQHIIFIIIESLVLTFHLINFPLGITMMIWTCFSTFSHFLITRCMQF